MCIPVVSLRFVDIGGVWHTYRPDTGQIVEAKPAIVSLGSERMDHSADTLNYWKGWDSTAPCARLTEILDKINSDGGWECWPAMK